MNHQKGMPSKGLLIYFVLCTLAMVWPGALIANRIDPMVLGMPFCWLILSVGTAGRTGILNSALRTFEIEGVGDGMYILYLMTVLVGVFAVTLIIQFVSMMFGGMADVLGEPTPTGGAEGG